MEYDTSLILGDEYLEDSLVVKFKSMHPDAKIPTLGTPSAAGFDLYSVEEVRLEPGDIAAIPLGFSTEIPDAVHCRIESRSGMAIRGYVVLTGVIDSDYRGEWKVILMNMSRDVARIAAGTRLAQAVFRPTIRPVFRAVEELTDTVRGAGGLGSTGY